MLEFSSTFQRLEICLYYAAILTSYYCVKSSFNYLYPQAVYIAPLKALVKERMDDWKKRFEKKLGKKSVSLFSIYFTALVC